MPVNDVSYQEIVKALSQKKVTLVAVSKTKPLEDIQELYDKGHRDFGENYVQELGEKHERLPQDIRWHFIGHLQTNKVKFIVPFIHLVHSVDSLKLLREINKEAAKSGRVVDCLLQVHIAREETKFGMDEQEVFEVLDILNTLQNVKIKGLMGMATLTADAEVVRGEYVFLSQLYKKLKNERPECSTFGVLSMGMSNDYNIAIEEGSNMVRIGSLIFGERNYN